MNALKLTVFAFAALMVSTAHADDAQVVQAQKDYANRDFTQAGVASAQAAADTYAQLVTEATDPKLKAQYLAAQSEALYFVATASGDKDFKIATYLKGEQLADQGVHLMGIPDITKVSDADVTKLKSTLSAADLNLLGECIYQRGANLGQWGQQNGVVASLNKWPELRDSMNLMVNLGLKALHAYAPYRIMGFGYYKIPGILGGDLQKGEKFLKAAVQGSLAPGQIYSVDGANNTYLAQILNDDNQTAQAKALLQAFIKADPATLSPNAIPETKQAQAEAADLLKDM